MNSPSWDAIKCFISIARCGSLTHASAELGVSTPTLSRRIDSLENTLGLKLLRRGPDGARLTSEGRQILTLVEPGANHLRQITRVARTIKNAPSAVSIRISSTEPMISEVLAPNLPKLFQFNPNIRIELEAATDITNLNIGETDIAIRLAKPKSDTLIAKKLPIIRMGLYCSRAYLADRDPSQLDFSDEKWLAYDSAYGDIPENLWFLNKGLEGAIIIRSTSVKALINATKADLGIALLPAFQAKNESLIALPESALPNRAPWIVFHRDTRLHKEMKAVRQWISETCERAFHAHSHST